MHFCHTHHLIGRTATLLKRQLLPRWTGMQLRSQLRHQQGLSVCLGCPVLRDLMTVLLPIWPIERLAPCKLAAVPHCSHPDTLVVLSRIASFMHQAFEVS